MGSFLTGGVMSEPSKRERKLAAVDARAVELADDEKATQRVVRSADTLRGG